MKRMTAVLSVLAMAMFTAGVLAQAKPNFAGTWVMDAPAAPAAGAAPAGAPGGGGGRGGGRGGGGWGMEITITQDATMLKIDGMAAGAAQSWTFKLDGSESKNMVAGRQGGAPTEQVSKAAWTGDKLVITTTTQFGEQKRTLSLAGGVLSIESVQPGRDGGPGTPATVTYKKK